MDRVLKYVTEKEEMESKIDWLDSENISGKWLIAFIGTETEPLYAIFFEKMDDKKYFRVESRPNGLVELVSLAEDDDPVKAFTLIAEEYMEAVVIDDKSDEEAVTEEEDDEDFEDDDYDEDEDEFYCCTNPDCSQMGMVVDPMTNELGDLICPYCGGILSPFVTPEISQARLSVLMRSLIGWLDINGVDIWQALDESGALEDEIMELTDGLFI